MASPKRWRARRKIFSYIAIIGLLGLIYPQSVAGSTDLSLDIYEGSMLSGFSSEESVCREHLPDIPERPAKKSFYLTVTAYSSSPDETSGDPFITASGRRTGTGTLAYNHLPFGTKVRFPEIFGDQVFQIDDRLKEGAGLYIADMWMPSKAEAKQWGAKILKIEIL